MLRSAELKPIVRSVKFDDEVDKVASMFRQRISKNWLRPKSAPNGMEVILNINLLPSGKIFDVSVMKSSGNTAFDKSAIVAVERVAEIPEVANLPVELFEQYFRRLHLMFRPEDLKN